MTFTALLSDVNRNQQRLAALCYRLQQERLTCARLLENFQAVCRRYRVPIRGVALEPFPIYAGARRDGVLRLVPLPSVRGGEGWTRGVTARFSTETVPEAVIVRVEGELDLTTAQALADAIEGAYRTQSGVIVDLSRLTYLDGSGIRVLLRFAEEKRGRFVVIGSTPTMHRLFEILRLVDVLPVVTTLGSAREYLGVQ